MFRYRKQCLKRKIHKFGSTAEKNSELCPVHSDNSSLTVYWCKCLLNTQGSKEPYIKPQLDIQVTTAQTKEDAVYALRPDNFSLLSI